METGGETFLAQIKTFVVSLLSGHFVFILLFEYINFFNCLRIILFLILFAIFVHMIVLFLKIGDSIISNGKSEIGL